MKARSDRHRPTLRASAAAAAFVLLAAGCTGGPSDETSGKSPQPARAEEPALDGVAFTDPEDRYTLTVHADWEARHGMIGEGVEVWLIAEAEANFTPNINVMTEDITWMSLREYLELSVANASNFVSDFELLSSEVVTGAAGQELAVMVSTGAGLEYLSVIGMGPDGAVIVTLTSPPDRFATIRDAAHPFLLTLQPT